MRITDWVKGRETFEILLGYLVSQGSAVKKGNVVKIAEANRLAMPITAAQAAAAQLMTSETRLTRDAARLTRELRAADTEARAAVAVGNKLAVKNHLRRKHIAQQKLVRCEAALDNVRQLLLSTREAESNAAVVDTYRTSALALKKTMKEGGMEEDAVHDTMDDLKEVLDKYNEVQKALGGAIDNTDIDELEEELRELTMGPGAPGGGAPGKEERERGWPLPMGFSKGGETSTAYSRMGENKMLIKGEPVPGPSGINRKRSHGSSSRPITSLSMPTVKRLRRETNQQSTMRKLDKEILGGIVGTRSGVSG
ncbi:uncharacterized protein [Epargyreus clarus]|uniref:uncharacterized protein n=1 Tax=Epargyreus clarus TaxID=520877 RepID=UPI003C2CCD65